MGVCVVAVALGLAAVKAAAGDSLIVLHTPPGEANRVGVALDRLAWPETLGNISGDDTIFLATKDLPAQRRILRRLGGLVNQR